MARRKRHLIAALIVAMTALGGMVGGLQLWQSITSPSVGGIKRAIKRELPLGSTEAQTKAFLRAHGVDAHNISARVSNRYNFDPFVAKYRDGSMIYASIPDVSRGFLTTGGIYMKFVFDKKGKLRKYDVSMVLTGL